MAVSKVAERLAAVLTRLQSMSAFRIDLPMSVDWHPQADREFDPADDEGFDEED